MAEDAGARDYQAEADSHLSEATLGLAPEEESLALAVLLNRAATRLHNLARAESTARKGEPEWATWAQLQNAARQAVLQASTGRDLAARLAGRRR